MDNLKQQRFFYFDRSYRPETVFHFFWDFDRLFVMVPWRPKTEFKAGSSALFSGGKAGEYFYIFLTIPGQRSFSRLEARQGSFLSERGLKKQPSG
ncbi:hypothetical protein X474_20810 [Dethiosulfatarculus sandiegensis]|uniref:Uncharacterized protein n=1 Tax=Dethiosulfatarculus sandiegensis TaxID=1429043 RepID=A0A0D2GBQ5_9BACT|nr:hypothetical protein X474_20810 [Dethiosulfatarculus sandiegensis]